MSLQKPPAPPVLFGGVCSLAAAFENEIAAVRSNGDYSLGLFVLCDLLLRWGRVRCRKSYHVASDLCQGRGTKAVIIAANRIVDSSYSSNLGSALIKDSRSQRKQCKRAVLFSRLYFQAPAYVYYMRIWKRYLHKKRHTTTT